MTTGELTNVFVLPLREQVVFPHQRFGISLGKAIFERVYQHCQEHRTQQVGLVCIASKKHAASGNLGSASNSSGETLPYSTNTAGPKKAVGVTVGTADPSSKDLPSKTDGDNSNAFGKFELYNVGTLCELQSHGRGTSGTTVSVQAKSRMEIKSLRMYDYYGIATVRLLDDPPPAVLRSDKDIRTQVELLHEVVKQFSESASGEKRRGILSLGDILRSLLSDERFPSQLRSQFENNLRSSKRERFAEDLENSPLGDQGQLTDDTGSYDGYSPGLLADMIAAHPHYRFSVFEQQTVLSEFDVKQRLEKVIRALQRLAKAQKISQEISSSMQTRSESEMKEAILRKQIRDLRKELKVVGKKKNKKAGENENANSDEDEDSEEDELQAMRDKVGRAHMSKAAEKIAGRELKRLSNMQSHHPEYTVSRTYLDLLCTLPWNRSSDDAVLQLNSAAAILDEDHYGLEKVKKRVLEFLAVRKLRSSVFSTSVNVVTNGGDEGSGPPGANDATVTDATNNGISTNSGSPADEGSATVVEDQQNGTDVNNPDARPKNTPPHHLPVVKRIIQPGDMGGTRSKSPKVDMRGPILCLLGPPGVGKTSLGKSIAKAMGRQFQRIALGGVRDEAELRGHRRTYIGSMPGVIIQALQTAGTNNPVILLDEIDKLAHGMTSNPQGCLLEILDQEQNFAFKDHYLNTPFDLSNVFFICTCNDLSTIDRPLLDRMEILELSGYSVEEKIFIAQRYLLPKQRKVHALEELSDSEELEENGPVVGGKAGSGGSPVTADSGFGENLYGRGAFNAPSRIQHADRSTSSRNSRRRFEDVERAASRHEPQLGLHRHDDYYNTSAYDLDDEVCVMGQKGFCGCKNCTCTKRTKTRFGPPPQNNKTTRRRNAADSEMYCSDVETTASSGSERLNSSSLRAVGRSSTEDEQEINPLFSCSVTFDGFSSANQRLQETQLVSLNAMKYSDSPTMSNSKFEGSTRSSSSSSATIPFNKNDKPFTGPKNVKPPVKTQVPPSSEVTQVVATSIPPSGKAAKRPPRLEVTRAALVKLITKYTAESGVRSLERRIAEICRWVAYEIVEKEGKNGVKVQDVYTINPADLFKICGIEVSKHEDFLQDTLTPGVAVGLAVTHYGGELLFVEAAKVKGNGNLTITGRLGDVMKESVRTALSLLRPYIPAPFQQHDLHVHFPAGAVPKDGPSAGVATTLALASLFLEKPCRNDTAVTGEITLRGQVLPVGGIKEKILAANRSPGIKYVLIPASNEANVEQDLGGQLNNVNLRIVYIRTIREALIHSFGVDNSLLPTAVETLSTAPAKL
ncbi:unnamed protein product [Amoebophrya sp. A120]|nr:unnamed protein product [Amoebophrya sp. A120]|eukprot:GSA120T00011454001.1